MKHAERPTDMLLRQKAANTGASRGRNPETGRRHYCHLPMFRAAFIKDVLAIKAELKKRAGRGLAKGE